MDAPCERSSEECADEISVKKDIVKVTGHKNLESTKSIYLFILLQNGVRFQNA